MAELPACVGTHGDAAVPQGTFMISFTQLHTQIFLVDWAGCATPHAGAHGGCGGVTLLPVWSVKSCTHAHTPTDTEGGIPFQVQIIPTHPSTSAASSRAVPQQSSRWRWRPGARNTHTVATDSDPNTFIRFFPSNKCNI